jgi:hypothetical protein
MSQRRFTSADFVSGNDGTIPDTVLDQADLDNLKEIAGIPNVGRSQRRFSEAQNISDTANEKAELMRKLNIKPGTPEWFQLWFSRPYLTGEKPVNK